MDLIHVSLAPSRSFVKEMVVGTTREIRAVRSSTSFLLGRSVVRSTKVQSDKMAESSDEGVVGGVSCDV